MPIEKSIDQKVENALESLDHIHAAAVPFYFYNKVLQRLERPKATIVDQWNTFILNPLVGIITICLIILLNSFVIIHNINSNKSADQNTIALTDEYNQNSSPSFYLENPKP